MGPRCDDPALRVGAAATLYMPASVGFYLLTLC